MTTAAPNTAASEPSTGLPAPADAGAAAPASRPTRRSDLGPLLLFALFGVFFVLPFAGDRIVYSPASDLNSHLSGIMEARNALLEGQFPVRVAPGQVDGMRYPILQFYGNGPYTAGALLTLGLGVNPYTAWKVLSALTVALAGFYTYKCALRLTRQTWPSVVAGVVFVAAPYVTTDVRARFAYPESVSFCLLPAVTYFTWRAFASRRRALRNIVLGGVFWCLVALSHNVTYLYGSLLIGLFFLTCVTLRPRKDLPRLLRAGAAYGVGLALALWYVGAQLAVLKYITIASGMGSPFFSASFTTLDILLSPLLKISPKALGTPNFGLQIGWPILAAVALGAFQTARGAFRLSFQGAMLARLLAAFALAFFVVWSPVDFWDSIPRILINVQFTYRVLMFVVLWGSLIAALALAIGFRNRGGMGHNLAWVLIFVTAVAAMPFSIWRHGKLDRSALDEVVRRPDMGMQAARAYRLMPDGLRAYRLDTPSDVSVVAAADLRDGVKFGATTTYSVTPDRPFVAQLPVLFYPGLMDVRLNGRPVPFGHLDGLVALPIPAGEGPQVVTVEFRGARWANGFSLLAWLGVLAAAAWGVLNGWKRMKLEAEKHPFSGHPPPVSAPPIFPLRAAGFAFALMAIPLSLTAAYTPLKKRVYQRGVGRVWASSEQDPGLLAAANAVDNDPDTAWAALGSGPAVFRIIPPDSRRVSRIVLEPRRTMLLEGWHKVAVVLYLEGRKVAEQSFTLPEAARQGVQELKLDAPQQADKVELRFAEPVTLTPDGSQRVDPGVVNPGYREIRVYSE